MPPSDNPGDVATSPRPPRANAWTATADVPATQPSFKPNMRFVFPIKAADLLYPSQPSSLVMVGDDFESVTTGNRELHEVWNLKTGQRVGRLIGASGESMGLKDPVLSPNGAYLAGRITGGVGQASTYDVWSVKSGSKVRTLIGPPMVQPGNPLPVGFLGADELLVLADGLQVWDVGTGRLLRQVNASVRRSPEDVTAVSAGGKLVAVLDADNAVTLFDAEAGQVAGDTSLPDDRNNAFHPHGLDQRAMAFSPDGKELAVYLAGSPSRIVVWTVADGKVAADYKLVGNGGRTAFMNRKQTPLAWLPDGSGWLVTGDRIVDRPSGMVLYEIPEHREDGATEYGPRRVLDDGHILLSFKSFGQSIGMETVALPADLIAQTRVAVRTAAPSN